MSAKEIFEGLQQSVGELVATVKGQTAKWDNDVSAQISKLETWKSNFITSDDLKKIRTHARLHSSVSMESMLIPFSSGYSIKEWLTIETLQTVYSGVEWVDRTDVEKELLTLMGQENIKYFNPSFKIVKVSWTKRSGYNLPYAVLGNRRQDSFLTTGAFVKHIRGEVPYGWYCEGLKENSGWQLCGYSTSGKPLSYVHTHPYTDGSENGGEVLIALPATVDRYVDLKDPANWAGILGD